MKQTIYSAHDLLQAFRNMGRGDTFTYEALGLLFDYLEELNPEYELDVIALCCEYSEDTPDDIIEAYGIEIDEDATEEDKLSEAMDYLEQVTAVVGKTRSGAIVYASDF